MPDDTLFPVGEPHVCAPEAPGVPRLQLPVRNQVEFYQGDLDSLIEPDHQARMIWAFVENLSTSDLCPQIGAVEGHAGRPPIDPHILMALWLYATLRGIGSARELERLCSAHVAYRWLCGGVSVNYHTLADFRSSSATLLERLFIDQVSALRAAGLVTLDYVAHDGLRTRAHAGTSSFRGKDTLARMRQEAQAQIETLRQELHADPGSCTRRQAAARTRGARERLERIEEALKQIPVVEAHKKDKKRKTRVSISDPDARVMKLPDGGFAPAYNIQLSADTGSQLIVGMGVSQSGGDHALLPQAVERIEKQSGATPRNVLVDGGFNKTENIEALSERTTVYAPPSEFKDKDGNVLPPKVNEGPGVQAWRARMKTPAAQEIYKQRSATIECVNALARNRGLRQLPLRSLERVKAVVWLFALAHNVAREASLQREALSRTRAQTG